MDQDTIYCGNQRYVEGDKMIFDGTISVKAVIQGNQRPVEAVFMEAKKIKNDKEFKYIYHQAQMRNIPVNVVDRSIIDEMVGNDKHGGICCVAHSRQWQTLEPYLQQPQVFMALLQGIEDPFNYGYALRSLYAAGCELVIVDGRDWENAQMTVCKSSAGASEKIGIHQCTDWDLLLKQLKNAGVTIYCGSRDNAQSIYTTQFDSRMVLCIGGEKRGLSSNIMAMSDKNVYIPYANDFRNSLNGSSAVSVMAFEIFRQRDKGTTT